MSELSEPLRNLTKKDVQFHWEKQHEEAFKALKDACCVAPVLAFYDVSRNGVIQCDASSYALGAVLLQDGKPVAYTSRALNQTQHNTIIIWLVSC